MDKRKFLKTSSILATASLMTPILSCKPETIIKESKELKNWAGNLTYGTNNIHFPKTVEEVSSIVKKSKSLRALGSQHSFNTIADSSNQLLSLREMTDLIEVDEESNSLTVSAGVRYGDICETVDNKGYALHNLASLPHISIAGACATSTHGSGVNNGSLAAQVKAIELVKADGDIVQISKANNPGLFNAVTIGLGSIGVVTKVTLDLLPSFTMQQHIYRNLPLAELKNNFMEIMSSGYSVSLFTDWQNGNVNQIWIKSRTDNPNPINTETYFGATLADRDMHPIDALSAESCTEQMGVEGKWYARLPHFKMGFTPSSGDELQAEYFVPIEHGYEAMMAVESLKEDIFPHLFISEIRTIAADDFIMSPFYKKDSVAIHFTWKPHWDEVHRLMPMVESVLAPYNVRPHWGKLFTIKPLILQSRIRRLDEFKSIREEFDPSDKFVNQFVKHNLYST